MKKKEKKKGKKRRSGESFIEYQRNMLGLSFTSQPWCLYKLEHLCFRTRAPASHPFFWHFNLLFRQISPFFLFFFIHLSAIKLIGQLTYNLVEFVITLTNCDTEEEARVSFFNPWIITMYRGVSGKCILFSLLFQI